MNSRHVYKHVLATTLLVVATAAPIGAQVTAGQNAPDAKLEEIVVTAQKRSENLQNVPISVQVINGQALNEQNYNNFAEVTQITPAVHISTGEANNELYIRGIGSGDQVSFDQSVAIFNDDIYNGRSRLSGATFLDLERIEVLKGPQSTFFGNSAIAGALNIVTQKPGNTFDASGRLLYGEYGQYAAEGAVTLPLSDILSMRLALSRTGERGWITNINTGEKAPDENNEAARLTFLFKPIDNLDATLKFEGSRNRTSHTAGSEPSQLVNCPPPAPVAAGFIPGCVQALTLGDAVPRGVHNDENSVLAGQGNALSTYDGVLTVNYREWGHTWTSVTGFTNYNFEGTQSLTAVPALYQQFSFPEQYHQFSQEFRVASATDQRVTYLAGLYFQTDQLVVAQEDNAPFLDAVVGIPGLGVLAPYLPFAIVTPFTQNEKVYSAFGSLSWNITDQLKFNAGLRAIRDSKNAVGSNLFGTSAQVYGGWEPIPPAIAGIWGAIAGQGIGGPSPKFTDSWDALTPSAGLQFQLTPEAMLYATYNKGFKSGGFNGPQLVSFPTFATYAPEHVNAYELGIKSKWLEDKLLVNADIFRSDYQDLQVNSPFFVPEFNAYEDVIRNAAASRAQGVELETQWAVSRDLRLSANVTYLESIYTEFPNSSPPSLQNSCAGNYVLPYCARYPQPVAGTANVNGQSTPYAPRWSGNVTGSYTLALPGNYRFITKLSPYLTSGYYTDGANGEDPFFHVGGYVRVDGSFTLEAPGGHWAVDLIGKNLTNRVIVTSTSLESATKEEPVNLALQLRAKY